MKISKLCYHFKLFKTNKEILIKDLELTKGVEIDVKC